MSDSVQKMNYCYAMVPARPGQGARVLAALAKAGVNLDAFSGFPRDKGRAQLDFVTSKMPALRRAAAKNGVKLSRAKKAFLITGVNKAGAVNAHVQKLAKAGISIVAADAVCAGMGRYGMILWVKPRDYARASRALKAK
jgi:hypothetical protein